LVGALLARGCPVTVLDNFSSGREEHLTPYRDNASFRLVRGDLLSVDDIATALDGVEMVYHLAANPDVKYCPGDATDKDLEQNVIATYNLLECMRRREIKKLAFSSTSAVYGISDRLPIPEVYAGRPVSLYGASKLSCEALIGAFAHLFGMTCWIFRFANIVGPRVRKRGRTVISDFVEALKRDPRSLRILGNGRQAKSYLLDRECVKAMLHVTSVVERPVEIVNLGCSDWITVDEIATIVGEEMQLDAFERTYTGTEGGWPGDVPRFRLDVSKLEGLGWRAAYTSEQAVRMSVRAVLQSGEQSHAPLEAPCSV
jgi:UDP-glucose 4-epimerase